jgi:hypothetical protein
MTITTSPHKASLATIIMPAAIPKIVSTRRRGQAITIATHLRTLGEEFHFVGAILCFHHRILGPSGPADW